MSVPKKFERQCLDSAVFHDCSMGGVRFEDINLSNAVFSNVNLQHVKLANVNLSHLSIDDACIEGLTIFGLDVSALIEAELKRKKSS